MRRGRREKGEGEDVRRGRRGKEGRGRGCEEREEVREG